MWIFLKDAFLSIVAKEVGSDTLIVRARLPGDLEAAFPGCIVTETRHRDYRFRTALSRHVVATRLFAEAMETQATNFKDSVPDDERHDTYYGVWRVMHEAQRQRMIRDDREAKARLPRKPMKKGDVA